MKNWKACEREIAELVEGVRLVDFANYLEGAAWTP